MKHLRKSILTLLALTLFGGAGAWAQGPTVTELTVPDNWSNDFTPLTAADLPGFVAVDSATADQWVYASTSGYAMLIYAFTTDGKAKYVIFDLGDKLWGSNLDRFIVHQQHGNSTQVFYTTGGGAIELTKSGANQWTLGQTPDYDLELQVEYYEAHALKDIPAGWTVMVNGVEQQPPYQGDSLMITETDSVTLVPDNPRRVKSVTLEDEAPATVIITIGDITLDITGCTTWADIIARNPGVIWEFNGLIDSDEGMLYDDGGDYVHPSDPYDPAQQSDYFWLM